jgi:hypothetical protein
MADTIEINLATLKHVFDEGPHLGLRRIHGCVPEVFIGPVILAAILAGDFGGIDRIIGPFDLSVARLTPK